VAEQESDGQVV